MVSVVEGFRWAVLGTARPEGGMLAFSAVTAVVLLVSGAFYFRRMEQNFADIV
jgi:lipopolysaccharide transport system permease protein